MDSLPDRPGSESTSPTKARRGGKLQRVTEDTRGIVTHLRQWIDLRLDLAVKEVNDQIDDAASQAAFGLVLAILAFFTGLFGLTTLALGLGWALGQPFYGFLIVFALLAIVSFIVLKVSQRHPIVVESKLFRKIRGSRYRDNQEEDASGTGDGEGAGANAAQRATGDAENGGSPPAAKTPEGNAGSAADRGSTQA